MLAQGVVLAHPANTGGSWLAGGSGTAAQEFWGALKTCTSPVPAVVMRNPGKADELGGFSALRICLQDRDE